MPKSRKFYWGGFVGGRLFVYPVDDGFGGGHLRNSPALFLTRKEARKQFRDVRKVALTHPGGGK